jgi:hypothetical protein
VLRIRDVYPGSRFLPIPDPGSKNSYKLNNIEHYYSFDVIKKKYGFRIRDPRYEKYQFRIQDPGSKRHRFPDPDPQHCLRVIEEYFDTQSVF